MVPIKVYRAVLGYLKAAANQRMVGRILNGSLDPSRFERAATAYVHSLSRAHLSLARAMMRLHRTRDTRFVFAMHRRGADETSALLRLIGDGGSGALLPKEILRIVTNAEKASGFGRIVSLSPGGLSQLEKLQLHATVAAGSYTTLQALAMIIGRRSVYESSDLYSYSSTSSPGACLG